LAGLLLRNNEPLKRGENKQLQKWREWKAGILLRDQGKCQECGEWGNKVYVLYDNNDMVAEGITLCGKCYIYPHQKHKERNSIDKRLYCHDLYTRKQQQKQARTRMNEILSRIPLTPHEKDIFIYRYGLRDGFFKTLDDTAEHFNIHSVVAGEICREILKHLEDIGD